MGADPRGAAVTHPEGLRVFPTHAAGLGAPGGGANPHPPPRSGRGRTCTRAPRSGRRGDPHQLPSLLKRQSGSHVLLRPRPTRGTRTPPRPGRWDPDWRALASPGAAGLAPPAPERRRLPRSPSPSLTQSSVPQLMVQGAGRGAPRGRRGSPVPLPGDPLAPRDPGGQGKPGPAQPPPSPARRSSPRVSATAPAPGRSSARWPEEAAAAAAAAPACPPALHPEKAGRAREGRGGAGRGRGAGPA